MASAKSKPAASMAQARGALSGASPSPRFCRSSSLCRSSRPSARYAARRLSAPFHSTISFVETRRTWAPRLPRLWATDCDPQLFAMPDRLERARSQECRPRPITNACRRTADRREWPLPFDLETACRRRGSCRKPGCWPECLICRRSRRLHPLPGRAATAVRKEPVGHHQLHVDAPRGLPAALHPRPRHPHLDRLPGARRDERGAAGLSSRRRRRSR